MSGFEPPLPRAVRRMADRINAATGCQPDVTYPASGRIRLTAANDRVEVTVDFKGKNGAWAGSTLKVDGELRPNADSDEEVTRTWNDPDGTGGLPSGELPPIPETGDITTAAAEVQQVFDRLRKQAGDAVRAGYDAHCRLWIIGLDYPGGGMRFFFSRLFGQRWTLDETGPFGRLQIVRDGENVTAEASGRFEKALAMLADERPGDGGTSGEGTVGGPASAARSNSVETRRMVVRRELPGPGYFS